MSADEIASLPVAAHACEKSHLYLWCPNALLSEGLAIMDAWGFTYKTNLVWYKIRKVASLLSWKAVGLTRRLDIEGDGIKLI